MKVIELQITAIRANAFVSCDLNLEVLSSQNYHSIQLIQTNSIIKGYATLNLDKTINE